MITLSTARNEYAYKLDGVTVTVNGPENYLIPASNAAWRHRWPRHDPSDADPHEPATAVHDERQIGSAFPRPLERLGSSLFLLKRAIRGESFQTFGSIKKPSLNIGCQLIFLSDLHRYLKEFDFRYNNRLAFGCGNI